MKRRESDAQPLDGSIAAWFLARIAATDSAAASIERQLTELSMCVDALTVEREALAAERATLTTEHDEYRKLYLQTLELCRKLELGIIGASR